MTDRNRNLPTMIWVLWVLAALVVGLRIGPHLEVIKLPPLIVAPFVCADSLTALALEIEGLRYSLERLK